MAAFGRSLHPPPGAPPGRIAPRRSNDNNNIRRSGILRRISRSRWSGDFRVGTNNLAVPTARSAGRYNAKITTAYLNIPISNTVVHTAVS